MCMHVCLYACACVRSAWCAHANRCPLLCMKVQAHTHGDSQSDTGFTLAHTHIQARVQFDPFESPCAFYMYLCACVCVCMHSGIHMQIITHNILCAHHISFMGLQSPQANIFAFPPIIRYRSKLAHCFCVKSNAAQEASWIRDFDPVYTVVWFVPLAPN